MTDYTVAYFSSLLCEVVHHNVCSHCFVLLLMDWQ